MVDEDCRDVQESQGQICIDITRAYAGARENIIFYKINEKYTKEEATFFPIIGFYRDDRDSSKNHLSFLFFSLLIKMLEREKERTIVK